MDVDQTLDSTGTAVETRGDERVCPECGFVGIDLRCPTDQAVMEVVAPRKSEHAKPPQLEGRVLAERYTLTHMIGSGTMGWVYEAHDEKINTRVAVKIMKGRRDRGLEERTKRFVAEARMSSMLREPHAVRVTDFGTTDDGLLYLVMELLVGETLGAVLRRERELDPDRAAHIAHQICLALKEAHTAGLVHRDLKPDNVFLIQTHGDPDFVKVLDFGTARMLEETDERLTIDGAIVGTPAYMSPEQASGGVADAVTPASDLYSLGIVLYEMLCGRLPYDTRKGLQMLLAHLHDEPNPLPPMVPDEMVDIVESLLVKSGSERPSDAGEIAQRLSEPALRWRARSSRELATPSTRPSHYTPDAMPAYAPAPATDGRAPRMWIAGALAAGVAGAAAWFVTQDSADEGPVAAPAPVAAIDDDASDTEAAPKITPPRPPPTQIVHADDGTASWTIGAERPGEPVRLAYGYQQGVEIIHTEAGWFFDILADHLNRPLRVIVPPDYEQVIDLVVADDAELGMMPPASYVALHERDPQVVLLARQQFQSSDTYQAMFVARPDAGIGSVADLAGRAVCFVDPHSTSGNLYPRVMLREAGIDPDTGLGHSQFSGSHFAVLDDVKARTCDAGTIASIELTKWLQIRREPISSVTIIGTSPPIPLQALVMRHDLDEEAMTRIETATRALIELTDRGGVPATPGFLIGGFEPAVDADYDPIRAMTAHQ